MESGEGVQLSPGMVTNILVERSFEVNMPKPHGSCDINIEKEANRHELFANDIALELYERISTSPYQYTQQLCLDLCMYLISSFSCFQTFPQKIHGQKNSP